MLKLMKLFLYIFLFSFNFLKIYFFASDIYSRVFNVLTIIDSFSIKQFNVLVKTYEDILNSIDTFIKIYTSSLSQFFLFLFSVCIDDIIRNVNSTSKEIPSQNLLLQFCNQIITSFTQLQFIFLIIILLNESCCTINLIPSNESGNYKSHSKDFLRS